MKSIRSIYILLVLVLFLSTDSSAQNDITDATIEEISKTLRIGNSRELAVYFNDVVELKIDGEKQNYSSLQAEAIMKNFFVKYPPTGFVKIHKGSSKEGLSYVLGKYSHKKGTHRVYMLIKKVEDGKYKIDTFDFTKE
ncbi:MAG: DUF4783 domain-containing protein [Bacteroidota bacterium]